MNPVPAMSTTPDFTAIAATHGTPLFVYDGDALVATAASIVDALATNIDIFYSMKANPNVSIVALLREAGTRAEVSSMTELRTALKAGHSPGDIMFLGPGKTAAEIDACIALGIYAIVCESFEELDAIDAAAAQVGKIPRVVLRVNPTFELKNSGLTMGGKARQFGIDEEALLAVQSLQQRHPNVALVGIHAYMGTRILSAVSIIQNTERILDLARRIAASQGMPLEFVSVGGGWGVPYFDDEVGLDLSAVAAGINAAATGHARTHPETRVAVELGRYLTATSGTYITRVLFTKASRGENFAITDGGTNHHMAAGGVGSFVKRNFPVAVIGSDGSEPTTQWNIAGPLCTPNDLIAKKAHLPALRRGDLIGVLRSGAYGPSASPGLFLSHGFPGEVLVLGGVAHLVRHADSPEDLLERQIMLTHEQLSGSARRAEHANAPRTEQPAVTYLERTPRP